MLPTLPKLPKTLVKGEKVDICKTTSAEYDTSKINAAMYLIPQYGLAWWEADLTLAGKGSPEEQANQRLNAETDIGRVRNSGDRYDGKMT